MKKTMDIMAQTLQQHNIGDHIPENVKKKYGEKAPEPRGNEILRHKDLDLQKIEETCKRTKE